MNHKRSLHWSKRLGVLSAGAFVAALPLLVPQSSAFAAYPEYPDDPDTTANQPPDEAAPPPREDDRDTRDNDNNRRRARIEGMVTRIVNNEMFEIRTTDGERVRIVSRGNGQVQPHVGDHIRAFGERDDDLFIARRIVDDQPGDNQGRDTDDRDYTFGTVTQILGADSFRMRDEAGRVIQVRAVDEDLRDLHVDDRIKVHGAFGANGIFVADRVLAADTPAEATDVNTNVHGVVTAIRANDALDIRADDNRTYRVRAVNGLPQWLHIGSAIVAYGTFADDDTFVAERVDTDTLSDRARVLRGSVTRVNSNTAFEMRGDDGLTYRVRLQPDDPHRVVVGDRVEVTGAVGDDRLIAADRVVLIDEYDTNDGRNTVDFPATIISIATRNRLLARGDNGRNYSVTTVTPIGKDYRVGDHVRIAGHTENGIVIADRLTPLQDETEAPDERRVNFPGTVVRVQRFDDYDDLQIRGDNDHIYSVRYRNDSNLRVNDRVRVVGIYRDNRVLADTITRR